MRLYKNCNLECASSTAERTKEHTHTTHGGGKKLVDLCAYVCNTFVLYIAHLVGHFFLLLVGHFYVSFQFYSVFVFEALSVDERCSFYCDMRCSAIIRLFPMLIKWLVRIYISSLSLSHLPILSLQSLRLFPREEKKSIYPNCWLLWTCTEKWKVCQMAEVFACAQRSSGNKFYGYGQRMSVTEKKSPSAFTTQPKEYIEYVPATYRKKEPRHA